MIVVRIIKKGELTDDQRIYLDERLNDPQHKNDCGPPQVWNVYTSGLYAAIDDETGKPFEIIEASGNKAKMAPGWWVDYLYRETGLASAMIDALAQYLKREGVTGVGYIMIQTYQSRYDSASEALKRRFCSHFPSQ